MNSKKISCILSTEIVSKIQPTKSSFELPKANIRNVIRFLKEAPQDSELRIANFSDSEEIVSMGIMTNPPGFPTEEFNYAKVPLGIIINGTAIVKKGGKATKKLEPGDFIGLFETSDFLLNGKNRQIGDWTLAANNGAEILFFPKNTVENPSLKNYLVKIARSDRVPQPITDMPLLDWAAAHMTETRLKDYAIVVHTHLLPNTFPFFRHLAHLVGFGKIFILEKPYSTVHHTYDKLIESGCEVIQVHMEPEMPYEYSARKGAELLWSKVIEEQRKTGFHKILVVDDGAELWLTIPWSELEKVSIAGVEQTQRGITRIDDSSHHIPPIISVASSGTKKLVESVFIGLSVIEKSKSFAEKSKLTKNKVGLLGFGSIGQAIARYLKSHNQIAYYYDPENIASDPEIAIECPSIDDLLNSTDVIIGTTGTDCLKGIPFERVSGNKTLASASSTDIEFNTLLRMAEPTNNPFGTRHVKVHHNLSFEILNGGYPLNFDRESNAVPDEDIALTWCLMYTGAMQAVSLIENKQHKGQIYNLDRISQKRILEKWSEEKEKNSQPLPFDRSKIQSIVNFSDQKSREDLPTVWQD